MSGQSILDEVDKLGVPLVELTGGEPLAQPQTPVLMRALIDKGYKVLVETSGSEDLSLVPSAVHVIMDLKCPGSGMEHKNLWSNLNLLKITDEVKFVLAGRSDFDWAVDVIKREKLAERFSILLSCAWGLLGPKDLAQWMVSEPAVKNCRLQLQQHKYIWGPRAKGV